MAHLQIGLLLRQLGAALTDEERAGIYLTNALTGWEPLDDAKKQLDFMPELADERDAANQIKQDTPVIVIIGNPPYNAFAGTSPEEEGGLVDAYKQGLTASTDQHGWDVKKFNLDELYVRFFRIAERRILKTGKGVVSFISNYSWSSEPSFVVMREKLLHSFDKFWVENMHGNRKISEYAPDGRSSETVFAIPGFSSGIKQGVVISLWVRKNVARPEGSEATVLYRDDLNDAKAIDRRVKLLDSLKENRLDQLYDKAEPIKANKFSFRPSKVSDDYYSWPSVKEISEVKAITGFKENRGFALISESREELARQMELYFDKGVTWEELEELGTGLTRDVARFDARIARKKSYRD